MNEPQEKFKPPGASQRHRQQRYKNLAVFALLLGMVALFYVLSIVRLGGSE